MSDATKAVAGVAKKLSKFFGKQIVWGFVSLLLAIPFTLLFLYLFELTLDEKNTFENRNSDFRFLALNLFLIFYCATVIGLFVIRWVAIGLKAFVLENVAPEKA